MDFRDLQNPASVSALGEWPRLSIGDLLIVCDALGLSHDLPTGKVSLGTFGDSVVLMLDDKPLRIEQRARWQEKLGGWRPGFVQLKKD